MSFTAIIMMIIAIIVIWGGLIASIIHLPKEENN
ncbi:methionine/alanine import family NSS transporter small subunit [Phocoenobacter skyensis]|uniref:Methionine/alanine import family NSS transporter small subunit n=1 Tax=Phocoenobacter skyensis TaxID=97481 RepID=A0A1H7UCK7_9PAST|nr:methionine/alanine import family NSS transporter small subunit [Pasteurella skyensis]MDP8080273.1 methionine/alanine import family NSS transporter small subunit [Pasteurella skyensis]MDP8086263.1 methionine/alanine import family NSS transporter small subunit [Pasteurella skyensis]MDP8162563.1 methionine/alanine import family NSS transporter small subunit [Pasteurella skyensis]MDP8171635.1 methionine/alanine import family NSS transporter small subunit [Pasteurella skyensis]MDP8172839.1 methi